MLYPPRGKETEGEGREPDEEVGSQFSSRSCLALIWDGGGCEEKWGGDGEGEGGGVEEWELASLCRRR